MSTSDSFYLPTISWFALRVQTGDPSCPTTLTGPMRLVELARWRNGRLSPGVSVIIHLPAPVRPCLEVIDWTLFPVAEAQAEIEAQEARRRRFRARLQAAA